MHYGTTAGGTPVERFELGDRGGPLVVEAITYGATIVGIHTPDRSGSSANIVLHYGDLHAYEHQPHPRAYYGATIGRYANRIARGELTLNGQTYELSKNEGEHTLHGGVHGFDDAVWSVERATASELQMRYVSVAGDQGFPGELRVEVTFSVRGDTLAIAYSARSDADTVVNLTNHSYFNLSPETGARAADHVMQIFAQAYTPVDSDLIPTGEIAPVENTRFDFRTPRTIGTQPYDTNWVLDPDRTTLAALLLGHPASGRMIEVRTAEPGVQIYTGNAQGIAVETQHFPDSPHHPHFPSTVLRAGELFASTTLYRFLIS